MSSHSDEPAIRPLTAEECEAFIQKFRSWQTVEQFNETYEELEKIIGEYLLVGPTEFREAYIARACAEKQPPEQMRLFPYEKGDFEFATNGIIRRFETTEVMNSGRRRTEEVNTRLASQTSGAPTVKHIDQDRMNWEDEDGQSRLIRQARAKAQKDYDFAVTELVLYMNAGWSGHQWDEFLERAFDEIPEACNRFRSVWILHSDTLHQVSDRGQRC